MSSLFCSGTGIKERAGWDPGICLAGGRICGVEFTLSSTCCTCPDHSVQSGNFGHSIEFWPRVLNAPNHSSREAMLNGFVWPSSRPLPPTPQAIPVSSEDCESRRGLNRPLTVWVSSVFNRFIRLSYAGARKTVISAYYKKSGSILKSLVQKYRLDPPVILKISPTNSIKRGWNRQISSTASAICILTRC